MAYGLRCRDSSGNITLEIDDRLSRVLAQFTIPVGVNSGSVTLPSNRSGVIWVIFNDKEIRVSSTDFAVPIAKYDYSLSGNTLSWSRSIRSGAAAPTLPVYVVVGIY